MILIEDTEDASQVNSTKMDEKPDQPSDSGEGADSQQVADETSQKREDETSQPAVDEATEASATSSPSPAENTETDISNQQEQTIPNEIADAPLPASDVGEPAEQMETEQA